MRLPPLGGVRRGEVSRSYRDGGVMSRKIVVAHDPSARVRREHPPHLNGEGERDRREEGNDMRRFIVGLLATVGFFTLLSIAGAIAFATYGPLASRKLPSSMVLSLDLRKVPPETS